MTSTVSACLDSAATQAMHLPHHLLLVQELTECSLAVRIRITIIVQCIAPRETLAGGITAARDRHLPLMMEHVGTQSLIRTCRMSCLVACW